MISDSQLPQILPYQYTFENFGPLLDYFYFGIIAYYYFVVTFDSVLIMPDTIC